jgi:two-component sensor histidine kinase
VAIAVQVSTRTIESIHEPVETVVRHIRRHMRTLLTAWELDPDRIDDALLVVEELVANAVDHARTRFRLIIDLIGSSLRLAVRDDSDCFPELRAQDPTATRGRGLQLVDDLALRWGCEPHDRGKTIWAVLGA